MQLECALIYFWPQAYGRPQTQEMTSKMVIVAQDCEVMEVNSFVPQCYLVLFLQTFGLGMRLGMQPLLYMNR